MSDLRRDFEGHGKDWTSPLIVSRDDTELANAKAEVERLKAQLAAYQLRKTEFHQVIAFADLDSQSVTLGLVSINPPQTAWISLLPDQAASIGYALIQSAITLNPTP